MAGRVRRSGQPRLRGHRPTAQRAVRRRPAWEKLGRDPYLLETSLPGVFAVGDVRSGSAKRVASAVGEGSIAVRFASEHLGRRSGLVAAGPTPSR
jgi:thioredoxin reductase (NADPH)